MTKIEPLRVRYGDDPEMDEWLQLTAAQQDARVEASWRQYAEFRASLTPDQTYAVDRRHGVEGCLSIRKLMRQHDFLAFMVGDLKQRQIRLVKLREWRRTGIYPGEA